MYKMYFFHEYRLHRKMTIVRENYSNFTTMIDNYFKYSITLKKHVCLFVFIFNMKILYIVEKGQMIDSMIFLILTGKFATICHLKGKWQPKFLSSHLKKALK